MNELGEQCGVWPFRVDWQTICPLTSKQIATITLSLPEKFTLSNGYFASDTASRQSALFENSLLQSPMEQSQSSLLTLNQGNALYLDHYRPLC